MESSAEKIPKVIHYIWFGGNEKSDLIKNCIKSWKKYLPDWKFKEWNEENYDVNKIPYTRDAYKEKKYAFVADYARFDILYQYGGVYLDTDVELLKPIPEEFLNYEGFTGVESSQKIAPGLIFAVEKQNKIIEEIIDEYKNSSFKFEKGMKIINDYTTEIFEKYGFIRNGQEQMVEGIKIFPCEYFSAYDQDIKEFNITEKTISVHHYTNSWGGKNSISFSFKMKLKKIVGVDNYRKILKIKRKFFGINKN